MTAQQKLISIIVPVYRVEEYLNQCVDSLVSQTYKNLEIILVDDGSPDDCGKICDNYSKRDARIQVIHKENGGLSDARNVAIDVARGSYILCIDSDDYIHSRAVEILHKSLTENRADISVISYENVYVGQIINLSEDRHNETAVYNTIEALENMLYQKNITTSAWGKLYNAELFANGIRYPKGKICEDLDTTYKLFAASKKIVSNSAKLYYYLQRDGSIIKSVFKPERIDALDFSKNQYYFIKQNYPTIEPAARNRLFMEALFIILSMPSNDILRHQDAWNRCVEVIKSNSIAVMMDAASPFRYRLYAMACIVSPRSVFIIESLKQRLRSIR